MAAATPLRLVVEGARRTAGESGTEDTLEVEAHEHASLPAGAFGRAARQRLGEAEVRFEQWDSILPRAAVQRVRVLGSTIFHVGGARGPRRCPRTVDGARSPTG